MENSSFKKITAVFMAAALFIGALPFCAFASNSIPLSRDGALLQDGNGTLYFPTTTAGAKAYIALDYSLDGGNKTAISRAFFEDLPTSQTGLGSTSATAAFRYKKFSQSGSQYLAKYASYNYVDANAAQKWMAPPYNIGEDQLISFRYAGIVISGNQIQKNEADVRLIMFVGYDRGKENSL